MIKLHTYAPTIVAAIYWNIGRQLFALIHLVTLSSITISSTSSYLLEHTALFHSKKQPTRIKSNQLRTFACCS